jgi:hypothetical protein
MHNRIGECCVLASLCNLIVVKAVIANYFPIGKIDPRGAHILICKSNRCFSDCTGAKI